MPNATILQPFGFEIYWQMLFYFVAKGKTADNGDKCNRKLCNKTLANIRQTRFEHLHKQNFRKKAKKQNENRPLQKNKGVSPDKIDTIRQVLFLPPFKAAERKVIIK